MRYSRGKQRRATSLSLSDSTTLGRKLASRLLASTSLFPSLFLSLFSLCLCLLAPRSHIHGSAAESRSEEGHGGSPPAKAAAADSPTTHGSNDVKGGKRCQTLLLFRPRFGGARSLPSLLARADQERKRALVRRGRTIVTSPSEGKQAPRDECSSLSSLESIKESEAEKNSLSSTTSTSSTSSLFFLNSLFSFRFL